MKIVIVTKNLSSGGAERVITQLLSEWCKNGISCNLILLNKELKFYSIPNEVSLYEIGKKSRFKFIDKIKRYLYVRKIIKKISPDIVLSLPEEIGIYVIGALIGTKIPVIVSERNNPKVMPYKKITRFLRKMLYPFSAGIIFQTKEAASFFSKKIREKSIILPNPLDLNRIPSPYEGKREKIIVGAGRLESQKNFSLLISAFKDFYNLHNDFKLTIYGEGSLREILLEEINNTGLPQGVISLPGRVTNLLDLINRSTAFVLSSDYEGMPNVLIEAMAMGVPCIATNCPSGGPAELIKHGENGFLVTVGNKYEIIEYLNILIENKELYNNISKESIKLKYVLDSKKISNQWLNYLKEKAR